MPVDPTGVGERVTSRSPVAGGAPSSFERLAGAAALLTGLADLLYAISFVIVARLSPDLGATLSALFLTSAGLLSTPALVALHERVRAADRELALWALALALAGAFGAAIHGAYDLANTIHPPPATDAGLPNQVDPRGLLTFGVSGIALLAFGRLIRRREELPARLGSLAYLLGALLVVLYLGRLIVLDPASPVIFVPVLLTGFVANPAWYAWLGLVLLRRPPA